MEVLTVRIKSLVGMLVKRPDYLYRYKNYYLTATVASSFIVIYVTKSDIKAGFIKLEDSLDISTSEKPKHGFIPITEIVAIEEHTSLLGALR